MSTNNQEYSTSIIVPAAAVFFPVFDKIQGDKEVVGIIELDFEFGPLMSSVLPPFSNSLICVVSNPCNQRTPMKLQVSSTDWLESFALFLKELWIQ